MIKLQTIIDRPFVPADNPIPAVYVNLVFAGVADGADRLSSRPVSSYVLLDSSGSMDGQKLSCAKLAVSEYIKSLRPIDNLTLMTFGGYVQTILRKQEMSDSGKSAALSLLTNIHATSETPMYGALKAALGDIKVSASSNEPFNGALAGVIRVVLVTDGQPTDVDPETRAKEYLDLARGLRVQNATLMSLGIGDDYNQDLLIKLYQANEGGPPEHITDPATQMNAIFSKISQDAKKVLMPSAKLQVKLIKGVTFIGAYKFAPAVQELKPSSVGVGNTLVFEVGDVVAGEGPEISMSFSLPARPSGEYREVSFATEGNPAVSSAVVVNRTNDKELVRTRHDLLPEAKYQEAREKCLAGSVMGGELPSTMLRQALTKRLNDPARTKLMSAQHVEDLRKALALSEQGKSANQDEVKETKSRMTRRRQ